MATYNQILDAIIAAEDGGDYESAQVLGDMLKEGDYEKESGPIAATLQGAGQGMTAGFGEELGAGVRAALVDPLVSSIFGGEIGGVRGIGEYFTGMGERYGEALQSQREALEAARREHPVISTGAELAGGLASGGAGMARTAATAPSTAAAIGRAIPTGAAYGGVAGLGYSEAEPFRAVGNLEEWQPEAVKAGLDVLKGAGTGAALGAAIPAAGAGARAVGRVVTMPGTRNARLTNEGRRSVMRAIDEDIESGFIGSVDELKQKLAESDIALMDAGPALQKLTQTLAQRPTVGARAIDDFLTTRNKEQYKRLYPKLSDALGSNDQFARARRNLLTNMRQQADEKYLDSYEIDVRLTPEMHRILRNPEMKPALRTANRLRRNREQPPLDTDAIKPGDMINTQDLDEVIKGMDELVGKHFKHTPTIGREISRPMRDNFAEMVYDQNDLYRRARAFWSSERGNEDAMDAGLKIFRKDADFILEDLRRMTPSERMHFRMGTLRALGRMLGEKRYSQDVIKGVFDKENKKQAIRIAFGSRKKFDDFMKFVEAEQNMFNTFSQATGNSATAKRILADSDLVENLAGLFGFGTTGSLLAAGLARRTARGLRGMGPEGFRRRYQQALSREQADILQSAGPEIIDQLQQTRIPMLLGQGGQPTVARGTGGLLMTEDVGGGGLLE